MILTSNHSKLDAVRNPSGIWINTSVFREEAIHFTKYGYYTSAPKNSPDWKAYWKEQRRRCKEGYEVAGVKITGDHYFYLNFTRIKLTKVLKGSVGKKILTFPDFWDGDYNYFWCKDIARYGTQYLGIENIDDLQLSLKLDPHCLEGGKHMIVGKSRRKGYSYKNAAIAANIYNHSPGSIVLIGAFVKDYLYPNGTMGMASSYLNFLNEHTGWKKSREYVDKQEHKRASYKKTLDGTIIESGYLSEIKAITFKDNPDAARGKDAALTLFEEAGKFPNLEDAYTATEPTLRSGKYITGQIVIFGTGGDMEDGTIDFANMFYNPDLYQLMQFVNIWDENAEQTNCGFFHPFFWNNDGYYDKQGNSDIKKAIDDENAERDKLRKKSSGNAVLQGRVQEYPANPSEAFLTVSTNDFPIVELRNRLTKIISEDLHVKLGQPGTLYRDSEGKATFKPDLRGELIPIYNRIPSTPDKKGCPIIFEYPVNNAPKGLYKIGYDPYAQDEGTSMGAIIVYKGAHKFSATRNTIVAVYYGRPGDVDECNRIFELFCELYNTQGMHENMIRDVKAYFQRRNKLHLLARQPDQVISAAIKDSKVSRVYGCHMNKELKDMGAKYTKQWFLQERDVDENGKVLTNIDFINDPGFIEEAILWNNKGNFDKMSAWFMVMIQCQEEELEKEYDDNQIDLNNDLNNLSLDLFK